MIKKKSPYHDYSNRFMKGSWTRYLMRKEIIENIGNIRKCINYGRFKGKICVSRRNDKWRRAYN